MILLVLYQLYCLNIGHQVILKVIFYIITCLVGWWNLNEFTETNRPSKKFIYEIEKALTVQEIAKKQEQNITNTSKINKMVLKDKNGLKFGSIKIEKNLNGKTVVNIRTSLNAEFNQEKIEKLEAFLADLDDKV